MSVMRNDVAQATAHARGFRRILVCIMLVGDEHSFVPYKVAIHSPLFMSRLHSFTSFQHISPLLRNEIAQVRIVKGHALLWHNISIPNRRINIVIPEKLTM